MEIKKENILNAYMKGDNNVKEMLRTIFPDMEFEKKILPVTERIKTFEDACRELGEEHPFVKAWNSVYQGCEESSKDSDIADVLAYHKLRIICAALNEGWQSEFTKDEVRYYPWHYLWTENELMKKDDVWKQKYNLIPTGYYITEFAGLAYASSLDSPSFRSADIGSRLCLKSAELAEYCGKQFIDIWADFYLIRK